MGSKKEVAPTSSSLLLIITREKQNGKRGKKRIWKFGGFAKNVLLTKCGSFRGAAVLS